MHRCPSIIIALSRHRFKAALHSRERPVAPPATTEPTPDRTDLYAAYVEALRSCGQEVSNLSPERLDAILSQQERALRERYGGEAFRFKVVIEGGKAKLKASRVRP